MTIKRQTCAKHPDRQAIGICVITRQPICGECSTRYEGVNYSLEGLKILQERRAAQGRKGRGGFLAWMALLSSPLLIGLVYLFYLMMFQEVMNLFKLEFSPLAVEIHRGAEHLGQGSCLTTLDAAVDYLRYTPQRVLPGYLLAMAPYSAAVLMLIDAISTHHRSRIPQDCLLLTAATFWRWFWLGWTQRKIQADLRGLPPLPFRGRVVAYMTMRLVCFSALTWGGVIIFPAFYGFFLSGMAAPMLLEQSGPAMERFRQGLGWVSHAGQRVVRVSLTLFFLWLILAFSVFVTQLLLLGLILPSFLGIDTTELRLTTSSPEWFFCMGYFLFVSFDLYWTVVSVMLFYDLQSRRLGSDLRLRLREVEEGVAT